MKLSGLYIAEQIKAEYGIIYMEGISSEDGYSRPFLMTKGRRTPEGHICVASVNDFGGKSKGIIRKKAETFLILTDWKEEYKDQIKILHSPYLCLNAVQTADVMNSLQKVYDRCEKWKDHISRLIMKNTSIQKLLDESAGMFTNPLTVMGVNFSLVAQTKQENIPPKARLFIDDGINMDYMNAFIQDEKYKSLSSATQPVIVPAFVNGCRSMNINLKTGENITHRLVQTEAYQKLKESEKCMLKVLAEYLEYLLLHAPSVAERDDLDVIFRTILTDRTADYMAVSRRLAELGWSAKHEYLCLVLQITYLDKKNMTINAICKYLKKQFEDSVSFQMGEEIVTFFNLTRLHADMDEIISHLTYFIRDSFLKAGYSRSLVGHMNLRRQYVQAKLALDVGSRKSPYVWIHRFNQVVLPYILEQTTRRLPGSMVCHEGILELKKLDEKHQSELLLTLKTYLEQNLNATQTANELYIHRSTFLYRLDKIKSVLQTNLEDPDEIFYLNFSIRLLEMEEEKENS